MTSPKARRRQRGTRVTVAVALVLAAAAVVLGALVVQSSVVMMVAAVLAVVLGAGATRITHSELVQSRRDAARDRAEQARAYRTLAAHRASANAVHVDALVERIHRREAAFRELETALVNAQRRAADATRKRNAEARRAVLAEQQGASLSRRLKETQDSAVEAAVRLTELERASDVLRAELTVWRTVSTESVRSHA